MIDVLVLDLFLDLFLPAFHLHQLTTHRTPCFLQSRLVAYLTIKEPAIKYPGLSHNAQFIPYTSYHQFVGQSRVRIGLPISLVAPLVNRGVDLAFKGRNPSR